MRTKWCNNASGGKGQDALRQKVDLLTFILPRLAKVAEQRRSGQSVLEMNDLGGDKEEMATNGV